ncbi:DUF4136 domain-containing protein [Dasania marina]|uniref:DUF4136 domain-containing protein n=1 Tax=Dasania marina TaxID=471499 RepID=UPI0030D9DE79
MNKIIGLIVLAGVLGLTACTTMQTETADISRFKSKQYRNYSWATTAMEHKQGRSERAVIMDHALREALNTQLTAKGYHLVASGQAQFVVDYRYTRKVTTDKSEPSDASKALDGAWDAGATMGDPGLQTEFAPDKISELFLRFSVRDKLSKKELWHGTASKIMDASSTSKAQIKMITQRVVQKLFNQFPSY